MENILVIPTETVKAQGEVTGLSFDIDPYLKMLDHVGCKFVPREPAETDKTLKQPIPYILIKQGSRLFVTYRNKKGGEARLADKASIGVGGHINDEDSDLVGDPRATFDAFIVGAMREVEEEVRFLQAGSENQVLDLPLYFVGIINDDTTDVGAVHLGFLGIVEIGDDVDVKHVCDSFDKSGFREINDLKNPENEDGKILENWSKLIMERIDEVFASLEKQKAYQPAARV